MAGPDGTTEYVDEKDIIIPGEEYKLLDGSTVKVVEVKGKYNIKRRIYKNLERNI